LLRRRDFFDRVVIFPPLELLFVYSLSMVAPATISLDHGMNWATFRGYIGDLMNDGVVDPTTIRQLLT